MPPTMRPRNQLVVVAELRQRTLRLCKFRSAMRNFRSGIEADELDALSR